MGRYQVSYFWNIELFQYTTYHSLSVTCLLRIRILLVIEKRKKKKHDLVHWQNGWMKFDLSLIINQGATMAHMNLTLCIGSLFPKRVLYLPVNLVSLTLVTTGEGGGIESTPNHLLSLFYFSSNILKVVFGIITKQDEQRRVLVRRGRGWGWGGKRGSWRGGWGG